MWFVDENATGMGGTFAELSAFLKEQQAFYEKQQAASEAKAEKAKSEMESKLAAIEAKLLATEAKLKPAPAASDEQLSALQSRLEAMHAAELLQEAELTACEDLLADVIALEASMGTQLTVEMAQANLSVAKMCKLVALSAKMPSDSAFARQIRRKFV
jgi:hypothetical protein